jgi:hypothetical protein
MAKSADVYLVYNGPADVLDLRNWVGRPEDDRYVFSSSTARSGALTVDQEGRKGRPVKFTEEEALELRTIPTYRFSLMRSDVAEAILSGKPLPGDAMEEPALEPAVVREYTKAEARAEARAQIAAHQEAGVDAPVTEEFPEIPASSTPLGEAPAAKS